MNINDRVRVKTINGTLVPAPDPHPTENYWILIGDTGTIVQDPKEQGDYASWSKDKRVLVRHDKSLDALGLTNHNVPNFTLASGVRFRGHFFLEAIRRSAMMFFQRGVKGNSNRSTWLGEGAFSASWSTDPADELQDQRRERHVARDDHLGVRVVEASFPAVLHVRRGAVRDAGRDCSVNRAFSAVWRPCVSWFCSRWLFCCGWASGSPLSLSSPASVGYQRL